MGRLEVLQNIFENRLFIFYLNYSKNIHVIILVPSPIIPRFFSIFFTENLYNFEQEKLVLVVLKKPAREVFFLNLVLYGIV